MAFAPFVAGLATPVVDLEAYYPEITASMVALGPSIYGFVIGKFILEDREQGVLVAFRTSPLSGRGYLLYRLTTTRPTPEGPDEELNHKITITPSVSNRHSESASP